MGNCCRCPRASSLHQPESADTLDDLSSVHHQAGMNGIEAELAHFQAERAHISQETEHAERDNDESYLDSKVNAAATIDLLNMSVDIHKGRSEEYHRIAEEQKERADMLAAAAVIRETENKENWLNITIQVCPICLDKKQDMTFGCGHMTCRECGTKLTTCPICRKPIAKRIKLYR